MSFDKNKAMRNAERFLSQGKIRAAINEYQRVVENDPKDFSTLNILGDLYAKNRDKSQAVGCFTLVAEHYNTQGFSHKAIAVYNKISRIEPGSIEVSAKLAELYQSKGSIAEARLHYKTLAEHYQQKGQKIEALAIWKQIAELDPNNTEIYLKIAETCVQESQTEEAARAFTEAGLRFLKQEKYESGLTAFSRALDIKKGDLRALKGLVKAQIGLGCADEAAQTLEEILEEQPHNRDVLYLLVDCYLDMENAPNAERAVVRLVEEEPANYLKFVDLVKLYLKSGDLGAATRILAMATEYLLVGGQSEEFLGWTNEVLARDPEHIDALRLLVRYYGWQRNEGELKNALKTLADAACHSESVEDEHYALAQLVLMVPQESRYAERLQALGAAHNLEINLPAEQPAASETNEIVEPEQFQGYSVSDIAETVSPNVGADEFDFAAVKSSYDFETNASIQENAGEVVKDFAFYDGASEVNVVENIFETHNQKVFAEISEPSENNFGIGGDSELQKEIDSIEYYIEQGYGDLAARSLDELEAQFGTRAEIQSLRSKLNQALPDAFPVVEPEQIINTEKTNGGEDKKNDRDSGFYQEYNARKIEEVKGFDIIGELKSEFDIEEEKPVNADDDYETHYHLATAYKEMGLLEDAIREFQDAIGLIKENDGTRRFFQCANHLGHCFMEKQMPQAAVKWFLRDLEVTDLTAEEKQAIYYDLGDAFEAGGEREKALDYFEQLYAENIDYRNVVERLENLQR